MNEHKGICNCLDTYLWCVNELDKFEEIVIFENDIKSIVTKEQFDAIKYEVEQMKELKITNEDIKLLKEMKDNCLKLSVYEDEKRLLKANAITKFLIEHEEKQELIDYLKEKKKEYTELYNKSYDIINFNRYESLNILCEEILSKIEKE